MQLIPLLSEASQPLDLGSLAPLFSSVCSLGITTWYLVINTMKIQPEKDELHRKEREKVREDMLGALIEVKNDLKAEIKELRDNLKDK